MGVLSVIDGGMMTTVQDLGRAGLASIGVPAGGAADPIALRLGNRLVGNDDGSAALEMTMLGGTFAFDQDAIIALVGGDVRASIEDNRQATSRSVPVVTPTAIRAGERLRVGPIVRGVRTYLCIRGGLSIRHVLKSASTFLGAQFGGLDGRALRAGDRLEWGGDSSIDAAPASRTMTVARTMTEETLTRRMLRAVDGSDADQFDAAARAVFWNATFTVSSRSDRVGVRLSGNTGQASSSGRMPSQGMMCGAIQIPPNGEPIILMVDHPTTGGYPVIACIATVDLPVLGQLRPNDRITFERVTQADALARLREREQRITEVMS